MATLQIPAMGYGLRYDYGIFRQLIQRGWQREEADNWLLHPDPWEVVRPNQSAKVQFETAFVLQRGDVVPKPGQSMTVLGIPYDRPVVGYGGNTVNTLRLWGADSADAF